MSLIKKILRPIVGTILSACIAAFVLWVGSFIFTPTVGYALLFLMAIGVLIFAMEKFALFIAWLFTDE